MKTGTVAWLMAAADKETIGGLGFTNYLKRRQGAAVNGDLICEWIRW
jgi:hypothetical protein